MSKNQPIDEIVVYLYSDCTNKTGMNKVETKIIKATARYYYTV